MRDSSDLLLPQLALLLLVVERVVLGATKIDSKTNAALLAYFFFVPR
jgi:hypothetical protein